jgi:teichoic acid transport system permease protein
MEDVPLAASPTVMWLEALAWTFVVGLGGYVYFWRGEKGYGRG